MMQCQVKKELRFGSGKIALAKDQFVRCEIGHSGETCLVYAQDKLDLLYTFNSFKHADQHLLEVVPEKRNTTHGKRKKH